MEKENSENESRTEKNGNGEEVFDAKRWQGIEPREDLLKRRRNPKKQ